MNWDLSGMKDTYKEGCVKGVVLKKRKIPGMDMQLSKKLCKNQEIKRDQSMMGAVSTKL